MLCCQPTPSASAVADGQARPATPAQVRAALTAAAELGMFFRLADPGRDEAGRDSAGRDSAGWRPARLLYDDRDGELDALIESARVRLGKCERRVAASLLFQGYAARLLSPQVGCLVTTGCVPAVPAARLSWCREPGTVRLGLRAGPGWQGRADTLIGLALTQSFGEHLDPLSAMIRARVSLPASLLRDNAASALIGALRLVDDKIELRWRHLANVALRHPRLRGSGTVSDGEPAFLRRSCCLYYRVEGGGKCGDCPLSGTAATRG
jgi:iron complex transport system ATP-binding protein